MKISRISIIIMVHLASLIFAQDEMTGIRGDKAAIAEAEAMVETMGGKVIWAQLKHKKTEYSSNSCSLNFLSDFSKRIECLKKVFEIGIQYLRGVSRSSSHLPQ